MSKDNELAKKIKLFLSRHACLNADFDPEFDDEDDKYASPDAGMLFAAQQSLERTGTLPNTLYMHSSWESGGYTPYTDKKARDQHDEIVKECKLQASTSFSDMD